MKIVRHEEDVGNDSFPFNIMMKAMTPVGSVPIRQNTEFGRVPRECVQTDLFMSPSSMDTE